MLSKTVHSIDSKYTFTIEQDDLSAQGFGGGCVIVLEAIDGCCFIVENLKHGYQLGNH
jgi:hypothetical protein